jgi:hypothetical protein
MRYIDITSVIAGAPKRALKTLKNADTLIQSLSDEDKVALSKTGNSKWSKIKSHLEKTSNRKCWYTESKNPGCLNDVEHFRPKGRVEDENGALTHWYWFLAFNPSNYRLSCTIPNRLNINSLYAGKSGGKGDQFPLLANSDHATDIGGVANEQPVILDPCNQNDTLLLAFSPDGRPVVSPLFAGNPIASLRVEKSNLLLNLDYPTFNVDRERIYNRVVELIERGDRYNLAGSNALDDVIHDLCSLMSADAEYSKAAECYIRCFRDRDWVENIITAI